MVRFWSTDHVHPRDRLAYWVEAVCATLVHLDCIAQGSRPFSSQIGIDTAGPLRVCTAAGTAQTVSRKPHKIARNPTDEFALTIHGFGTSAFTQLGRNVALKPGDLVLHDMDRPFEISFDAEWSQTIVLFPRAALLSRLGSVECHMGARIDGAVGVASVLSPLLQSLPTHLDRISGDARERLADNVLDLIATAILFACGQPCRSRTTTLARVKLWIENHLGEALSAELIAARCGLSTRHLNRLFAREETSLMQYVSEQRLARCHRDLADPTMRGRSITDIALAAGFNDLSHFSRSYRARYGRAPKELRRSAMAG